MSQPVRFVVVGLLGGVLNYVKSWPTEEEANSDADRIASKGYEINPTPEELAKDEHAKWHDDENDVWVAPDDGSW